jgi:hypothetical protein
VDIRNDEQELLAICWFGYRDRSNYLIPDSNVEKGIRIRTKNIAIGDEATCKRFFNEERTNSRFIGEIHTLNEGFIPNARRDYFIENATCQQFEKNAKKIFTDQNLENRFAQTASKLYNRLQEIKKYTTEYEKFKELKGAFGNEATETFHLNRLRELQDKAVIAKREIEKINAKSNNTPTIQTLYKSIIRENDTTIVYLSTEDILVSKYNPPKFQKLNDEQKKVVLEIFEILEDELDFNMSELIKKRIFEKFN